MPNDQPNSPIPQNILEKLQDFLATKGKSPGGGWAEVGPDDLRQLYDLIGTIVNEKYEPDADGDRPVEYELINRTTHRRSHYMPVPYDHRSGFASWFQAVDLNFSIANEQMRGALQHLNTYKFPGL